MTFSAPKAPRFRDMIAAVVALILLVFAFINLGVVVKLIGAGLMVIPSALGVVHQVGPQEIFAYDLSSSPTTLGIGRPGRYSVYAYDYDLLTVSDQLVQSGALPWITLESQASGEKVPVTFVTRGLRLYDTPLAKGRPALSFVITQPGSYIMRHPTKPTTIWVVRDYITGKEKLVTAVFLIEIALVAIPVGLPFMRRYLARRAARKRSQQEARRRLETARQREERPAETWRRPK
jgi:hypothetical protein